MTLSCERARDLAADLLDGEVPMDLRRQVEENVATCPTCPELYRAMLAVHQELTRLRTSEAAASE
jgi:predicted anti-sigma-YlaC factor YlaD